MQSIVQLFETRRNNDRLKWGEVMVGDKMSSHWRHNQGLNSNENGLDDATCKMARDSNWKIAK